MASSSSGRHGGKRENSGRKKKYEGFASSQKGWNSQNKRIYLTLKMFDAWRDAKIEAGYSRCSDSEFAAHLLSLEYRRRANTSQNRKRKRIVACEPVSVQEIAAHCSFSQAPNTSTPLKDVRMQHSESPSFSPIQGNQANFVETDRESDNGAHSVTLSASFDANETMDSCNRANTSIFTDDEEGNDDNSSTEDVSLHDLSTSAITELNTQRPSFIEYDTDGDFDGYEDTMRLSNLLTEEEEEDEIYAMPDDQVQDTDEVNASESRDNFQIPFGPHRKFSRENELYSTKEEFKMVQETKFICCLDLLLAVFQARCQTPGCTALPSVRFHFVGVTIIVNSTCSSGHTHRFCSSHQINDLYASNLQVAASILLSGNQFEKTKRMAQFLHLEFLSKSTFYRFQRLYIIPEINGWWSWMKGELVREFSGQDLVVGGDGQCDSPGFNAKNICYFMMEVDTNYILDIEVLDKRHVGLISTNMEKEAVQQSLQRLNQELKIVELVTDASTSVTALLEKQYKDIVHSLDVWHKTKSIKKCLTKLGKPKAMSKVKDWSAHIVRHFWYCSSACRKDKSTSDEEALRIMKDKWIGLLHHICNVHQWLGGQCDHDVNFEHEGLPWFDRRDNDFIELQKIILNPELLASFKFYTRFRHTGGIECANSLGLVYTPKHTSFSYRAYKARRQLVAIDWNFHQGLPQATAKSGEKMVTRKYNQRTRQWDIKKVKIEKGYEYIPVLMSKILRRREGDFGGVTQIVDLNTSDPALISPTIAHKPAPPTKEILQRRSRFGKE